MSHPSQKTTMDTLTASSNETLTTYPRLKVSSCHIMKKLFSLIQRQVTMIQFIAALIVICIFTLLILANLAQKTQTTETNIEPAASPKYASPKYAAIAHAMASEIIPQVILSRNQMENIRRELDDRRQRVMRLCKTIVSRRSHLNTTLMNMIVDTEHNVSWCPIYKAASSTWMNYFAVLKGTPMAVTMDLVRRNVVQISDIVRQKFQPDADFNKTYERVSKSKKFLIVRHPLERLLSAYRDKLEHMQGREYYYKRFGRRIALKYRQSSDSTKLEPTFEEFLRFIANEKYFDEHWAPYYHTCNPCTVNYDYILKFETLERDQAFFIQDTNLSEYLYDRNHLRNINPYGATTTETLREYIQEIPQSLLKEIYKVYESDYKLFDYSFI
ncbi:hypothetical protein DMN91_006973 [Ooceraea biroi]|uniref:Carbohydrate sulfotransferase n=1 Tax=Ooceraea biroi TaxID=2015173 RepID=A0A3L8DIT7_OOCBI|nr:carbohydrate sulfotransferase 11 [Ooceraea biroi]RLU20365.1 hypothetical protein DMN91_006973 [Ooceraea biroi]